MRPLDNYIKAQLDGHIVKIGEKLGNADTISIVSPIVSGVDTKVRDAIEAKKKKKPRLVIVLQTPGGVVEVVERIVGVIRNFYHDSDRNRAR